MVVWRRQLSGHCNDTTTRGVNILNIDWSQNTAVSPGSVYQILLSSLKTFSTPASSRCWRVYSAQFTTFICSIQMRRPWHLLLFLPYFLLFSNAVSWVSLKNITILISTCFVAFWLWNSGFAAIILHRFMMFDCTAAMDSVTWKCSEPPKYFLECGAHKFVGGLFCALLNPALRVDFVFTSFCPDVSPHGHILWSSALNPADCGWRVPPNVGRTRVVFHTIETVAVRTQQSASL